MRKTLLLSLMLVATAASAAYAAPAIYKKSGPDPYGTTTFWVKCENGNVSTAVCLKDESHCGVGNNQSLMTAAVTACESIQGLQMAPSK